jgi:hypothetical protein
VFIEHAMVKGDVTMHAPAILEMEHHCTIPITSGKHLEIALPGEGKGNNKLLLIYG